MAELLMKDQRYTPSWVWQLAQDCLGEIDLDPTAAPDPKFWRATKNITEEMDCFIESWGKPQTVWMNPPYSNAAKFLNLFAAEQSRCYFRGITLTLPGVLHNKGTSQILKCALEDGALTGACFTTGRIQFLNTGNSNDRDSLFLYWGPRIDLFRDVFSPVGIVVKF